MAAVQTTNEVRYVVCYPEWMAIEAGAAAFASTAEKNITCIAFSKEMTKDGSLAGNIAFSEPKGASYVVALLGTYWLDAGDRSLRILLQSPLHVTVSMYCSGNPPAVCQALMKEFDGRLACFDGKAAGKGPCAFMLSWLQTCGIAIPTLFEAMLKFPHWKTLLELIDARQLQVDMQTNQTLFSGVYNYDGFDAKSKHFARFRELFLNPPTLLEDVTKCGRAVANIQYIMARDRVSANAGMLPLADGKTLVAVCPAPELVVVTHQQLHEEFPEASGTVTMTHRLDRKSRTVSLNYSIRGYGPELDAAALASKVGGGGDKTSAGATIKLLDFSLPF